MGAPYGVRISGGPLMNAQEVNVKGTYLPTHALLKRRHAANITSEATVICTSCVCASAGTLPAY
jgi:hypothetical protein